jgi:ArsR family transcriptional regulator, arsenate/arsenite/antimonite-responsive transcriptional repressor
MRDAAQFFRILADEARLKIIWLLFHHDELCVCDIMAALGITQSKASRHLATLKHAGLVTGWKDGLWSHYALCPTQDQLAKIHLALLRRSLADRADAASLLKTLQRWLDSKKPGMACAKAAARAAKDSMKKTGTQHAGAPR